MKTLAERQGVDTVSGVEFDEVRKINRQNEENISFSKCLFLLCKLTKFQGLITKVQFHCWTALWWKTDFEKLFFLYSICQKWDSNVTKISFCKIYNNGNLWIYLAVSSLLILYKLTLCWWEIGNRLAEFCELC